MRKELVLGCGSRMVKDLVFDNRSEFENVVRVDINPDHSPDVVWDLRKHPLPFGDNEFDEIHCYEVLEHLAYQGDYEFFFSEFTEYARILKPGGLFLASVPAVGSEWLWGDPSHRRVITDESLTFLDQQSYEQIGKTTMSDFRNIYKANLKKIYAHATPHKFFFILENRK
jgi:predicted SAM-dependent methyltransferase